MGIWDTNAYSYNFHLFQPSIAAVNRIYPKYHWRSLKVSRTKESYSSSYTNSYQTLSSFAISSLPTWLPTFIDTLRSPIAAKRLMAAPRRFLAGLASSGRALSSIIYPTARSTRRTIDLSSTQGTRYTLRASFTIARSHTVPRSSAPAAGWIGRGPGDASPWSRQFVWFFGPERSTVRVLRCCTRSAVSGARLLIFGCHLDPPGRSVFRNNADGRSSPRAFTYYWPLSGTLKGLCSLSVRAAAACCSANADAVQFCEPAGPARCVPYARDTGFLGTVVLLYNFSILAAPVSVCL